MNRRTFIAATPGTARALPLATKLDGTVVADVTIKA